MTTAIESTVLALAELGGIKPLTAGVAVAAAAGALAVGVVAAAVVTAGVVAAGVVATGAVTAGVVTAGVVTAGAAAAAGGALASCAQAGALAPAKAHNRAAVIFSWYILALRIVVRALMSSVK